MKTARVSTTYRVRYLFFQKNLEKNSPVILLKEGAWRGPWNWRGLVKGGGGNRPSIISFVFSSLEVKCPLSRCSVRTQF
jgi:hypothetical protein